ncbi:MAG: hypothetical protein LKE37_08855 [Atopobiaceae bacterium]|nr:hypothetical protein [Atopobiaceae bacterium]
MDKRERAAELLSAPTLSARLSGCAGAGAVRALAAECGLGLTDDEAERAFDSIGEGELQRDELDAVSGGGVGCVLSTATEQKGVRWKSWTRSGREEPHVHAGAETKGRRDVRQIRPQPC